jgi:dihydropteroate synthase
MGRIGRPEGAEPLGQEDRLPASLAVGVWALAQGATMVRVHDVAATVQAVRLVGDVGVQADGPGRAA